MWGLEYEADVFGAAWSMPPAVCGKSKQGTGRRKPRSVFWFSSDAADATPRCTTGLVTPLEPSCRRHASSMTPPASRASRCSRTEVEPRGSPKGPRGRQPCCLKQADRPIPRRADIAGGPLQPSPPSIQTQHVPEPLFACDEVSALCGRRARPGMKGDAGICAEG